MKRYAFISATLGMAAPIGAAEVSLYDCDYSDDATLLGQSIAIAGAAFPQRTECSAIEFGQALVEQAPAPWTGTAAILHPDPTGSFHSATLQFILVNGGIYAFRSHRIETTFRFLDAGSLTGDESLRIFTDGGVTYSLDFHANGSVLLFYHVMEYGGYWGDRVVMEHQPMTSFDPEQPVHLIWETDIDAGSTTVSINGQATTVTGLSPVSYGIRNWQLFPGPLFVRFGFEDGGRGRTLAVRSMKITGDDYDGPLYTEPDAGTPESDVITVPFEAPASGIWQPQFSLDGNKWKSYGVPIGADLPFQSVSFSRLVSPTMFFRLEKVDD